MALLGTNLLDTLVYMEAQFSLTVFLPHICETRAELCGKCVFSLTFVVGVHFCMARWWIPPKNRAFVVTENKSTRKHSRDYNILKTASTNEPIRLIEVRMKNLTLLTSTLIIFITRYRDFGKFIPPTEQ